MWSTLFFVYNFISLYLSASISINLKNVAGVEKINYLNNVTLLLIVAVLTASLSTTFALKFGCETHRENLNFGLYSTLGITILNLFLDGMYLAMIANPQFKTVPADVRKLIIIAFVLNILGTLAGIAFVGYKGRQMSIGKFK